jgi:hypothetical protein
VRARIDLVIEREPASGAGIEEANLPVRAVEEAFVRDHFEVDVEDGVARENL